VFWNLNINVFEIVGMRILNYYFISVHKLKPLFALENAKVTEIKEVIANISNLIKKKLADEVSPFKYLFPLKYMLPDFP